MIINMSVSGITIFEKYVDMCVSDINHHIVDIR